MRDATTTPVLSLRLVDRIARRVIGLDQQSHAKARVAPLSFQVVNPTTRGLYWVQGTARSSGVVRRWSCVLKVLRANRNAQSPTNWNYWEREAYAYESGLLGKLAAGLRAPRHFGIHRPSAEETWIFLEKLPRGHATWTLARHEQVARHLGIFNGQFLGRDRIPRQRWLSRELLRGSPASRAGSLALVTDPSTWKHPLLRRALPSTFSRALRKTLEQSESLLDSLAGLPPTLCHFDAYQPNLFPTREHTVAIDWGFVGLGAIGMDLGQMLANNALWLLVPPRELARFRGRLLAAYLRGLGEAGASVNPEEVCRAVDISAAIRVAVFAPFLLSVARDAQRHSYWKEKFGASIERTFEPWGAGVDLLLSRPTQ